MASVYVTMYTGWEMMTAEPNSNWNGQRNWTQICYKFKTPARITWYYRFELLSAIYRRQVTALVHYNIISIQNLHFRKKESSSWAARREECLLLNFTRSTFGKFNNSFEQKVTYFNLKLHLYEYNHHAFEMNFNKKLLKLDQS